MAEHVLTLKYDGGLASRHEMDAADIHHAYEGGKRVLALHGYMYCEGRIPRSKLSETPYFAIRARPPRSGSVFLELAIGIAASAIYDIGKYTFKDYFVPAVGAWLNGVDACEPPDVRIEPTFRALDNGNRPFIDEDGERIRRQKDLSDGNAQAMDQITRPIGGHADMVEMLFDGARIARFRHRLREHEITEAVNVLKQRLSHQRRFEGPGMVWKSR